MMKVTYLYHSGFLIETNHCYYLFDYYRGQLPELSPVKPLLVFASHNHQDHYNPAIFAKLKEAKANLVLAILSQDICVASLPDEIPILCAAPDKQYTLPQGQLLTTLCSTDQGVAFILQSQEGTIYHAGDLNDWVWEEESPAYNEAMTRNYRQEIDKLKNTSIDIAFLPLDPRQGKNYARGILYFLQKTLPNQVFPMHYWEKSEIITQFHHEYPQFNNLIQFTENYSILPKSPAGVGR